MRCEAIPVSSLLANRDFHLLWGSQALSRLGTQATAIALPLLVLKSTGSPARAGVVGFAAGLTQALLLLPAGSAADRHAPRRILLSCDTIAAAAAAGLAVAAGFAHSSFLLILALAMTLEALGTIFVGAGGAAFRRVVPDDQLTGAVAVLEVRNSAVYLIGPALGGLLFALAPSLPFTVDAVTFALSVAAVAAIRTPLGRTPSAAPRPPIIKDMMSGLVFLWRTRCLRFAAVTAGLMNFAFSAVFFAVIVGSSRRGGGLPTGVLISCAGAGSLAGALVSARAKELLPPRAVIAGIAFVCAAAVTAMAATTNPVAVGILITISTLAVPTANVVIGAAEIHLTPADMQGRVQTSSSFLAICLEPAGALAAGLLLSALPLWQTFAAFGAVLAAVAVACLTSRAAGQLPDLRARTRAAAQREPETNTVPETSPTPATNTAPETNPAPETYTESETETEAAAEPETAR